MSIRTRFNPLGTIGRKGLLPAGYIELEYLEGTGTQYIDTGVDCTSNTGVEFKAQMLSVVNAANAGGIYFADGQQFGTAIRHHCTIDKTIFYWYGTNDNWSNLMAPVSVDDLLPHEITINPVTRVATFDSYSVAIPQFDPFRTETNYYLFSRLNGATSAFQSRPSRIYYFKLFNNGRLVRSFIPALDPTGRPCMFDTVTQQPFYNEGTGEFKCGYKLPTGYTQVSAIYFNNATSTSMCYVNLGYILKDGCILRTTLSCPSIVNRWQYSGYYESGESVQWGVSPIVSGQAPVAPYVAVRSDILRGSVNDGLPHEYVIDLKNLKIGIDSSSASLAGRVTPRPYNIYLGNRNGDGQYLLNAAADMTLYSFFYKDASVKSVLVPCKDNSNNACLYDICRKVALYSAGNIPLQVAP